MEEEEEEREAAGGGGGEMGSGATQVLPSFLRAAACEQLERDGLTVLGAGLGAPSLAAQLLSIHMRARAAAAPGAGAGGGVVVVLGAAADFRAAVASELRRMHAAGAGPAGLPHEVSADTP